MSIIFIAPAIISIAYNFVVITNVIYNRTLWCRSYTSITAPHELSSVSRGLGIFALWALDT